MYGKIEFMKKLINLYVVIIPLVNDKLSFNEYLFYIIYIVK